MVKGVVYVSSAKAIGNGRGQYTTYLHHDGQILTVREPDGTHISPSGALILGGAVITAMQAQLHVDFSGQAPKGPHHPTTTHHRAHAHTSGHG
jgi:hypothetical protein